MAGRMARSGAALAVLLLAAMPAIAGAQAKRYGAVADVPLARTGGGWTTQGWTGPEDGPDMTRLPPVATPPPVHVPTPVVRALPPVQAPMQASVQPPLRTVAQLPTPAPTFVPYDGRYVRPDRGGMLPALFALPVYRVQDARARGLPMPRRGDSWVRYYDDAVLVGPNGRIVDVRYGLDWGRAGPVAPVAVARNDRRLAPPIQPRRPLPDRAYDDGYEDGYDDGHDDGAAWAGDTLPPTGYAPGTVVTTTTPGTITTTTTVTEDVVYSRVARPRRRAAPMRGKGWSAPARRWSK